MSRVAIIGSCITRDVWRFRGEADAGLLYISRTSLPSLFSPPVNGFQPREEPPASLKPQPHRALVADLSKTALASLIAYRPTHLIFDFIDERFDLLSVAGGLATRSWELETSGYLKQAAFKGARTVPRLSPACERLWQESAGELAAFIRATPLRKATLILHAARWADRRRNEQGRELPLENVEILPAQPADIGAHNALLARYEAAFTELMPDVARIEAADLRVADDAHPWGLSPFHYVPEYYAAIWAQLEDLGAAPAGAI